MKTIGLIVTSFNQIIISTLLEKFQFNQILIYSFKYMLMCPLVNLLVSLSSLRFFPIVSRDRCFERAAAVIGQNVRYC